MLTALELDDFLEDVLDTAEPVYWTPFKDKPQERAYHCTADIIGYGGAGGGGKSDLLLGKGFTQFQRGYIFRRHYTDLVDLVDRGDTILDGVSSFVWGNRRQWSLPGRFLRLGAVDHEKDLRKQKGRAKDFIGIDEADEFTESEVRFLMGWLRTADPAQRTQVCLCFNPPNTPAGEWLIKFFAPWIDAEYNGVKAEYGELRWYIRTADDKDLEVAGPEPVTIDDKVYTPKSRTFFLSLVDDNPVYMATGYDKQLESLDEPLRSQLRYGNFTVSLHDDMWQVIPTEWIMAAQNRWTETRRPDLKARAAAVDPSRGGEDETAIAALYGNYIELTTHAGTVVQDGAIAAELVMKFLGEQDPPIAVDGIGIGSSVYDHLKVIPGITAYNVNVSEGSKQRDKTGRYGFQNLRSQIAWKLREALDPNSGEDLCLPNDTQLRNDLRAARYKVTGGKYIVEPKADIKKRIGRSPDKGDVVMLLWHIATNTPGGAVDFDW